MEHYTEVPTKENLALDSAKSVEVLHATLESTFEINLNIHIL